MTATLPHSSHFPHQSYNHTPTLGSYNHSHPNGSSRLAVSHSFPSNASSTSRQPTYASSRQLPPLGSMPSSNSTSQMQYQQRKEKGPNWEEFYKNGPPKEIIVIDDDDSPPPAKRKVATRGGGSPQARAGAKQPTTKKRRTGYDSVRDYHGSYPSRTFSPRESADNTGSSDRTTSLQTTAPTSLGSHTSHGSTGAYIDDVGVGQKRKRVTRQQIASEKRRQEPNAVETYVPPPKPPIKAKDVHVPSLRDVRLSTYSCSNASDKKQTYTHHINVDDEDGHYIVCPDAMISDRCEWFEDADRSKYLLLCRSNYKASGSRNIRKSCRGT